MRRLRAPLLGAALAGAVLGAAVTAAQGSEDTGRPQARAASTAIGTSLREFRIGLYKRRVRPGTIRFNAGNYGEDAHDLVVFGPGRDGPRRGSLGEVAPGGEGTLRVRLRRAGVYWLVCSLADHEARGMRTTVRVLRKRR